MSTMAHIGKQNTTFFKNKSVFVKHNTKLLKQHKILADNLGEPWYKNMKTRQVSNKSISEVKTSVSKDKSYS